MDHAFWPFGTTKLYIDQTGDMDILFEKVPYFKDLQSGRGTTHDEEWNTAYGKQQKVESGDIYFGTILEHILLQNLTAFYDVGEHNEMKPMEPTGTMPWIWRGTMVRVWRLPVPMQEI